MSCSFDFSGKAVFVTGSTKGIGFAIARDFLSSGASVALNGRSEESVRSAKEALLNEFPDAEGRLSLFEGDLSNQDTAEDLAKRLTEHFGQVDILVNNAGITRDNLLLRMKTDDWDAVMGTNLKSAFLMSKLLLRGMLRATWGRIINISSVVGATGNPGQANYSASKAGLVGFTKALAKEVANKGITVNAVAPGYIETDMTASIPEPAKQALMNNLPNKRLGQGSDISASVLFLASEEASYITGQTLHVNGGLWG